MSVQGVDKTMGKSLRHHELHLRITCGRGVHHHDEDREWVEITVVGKNHQGISIKITRGGGVTQLISILGRMDDTTEISTMENSITTRVIGKLVDMVEEDGVTMEGYKEWNLVSRTDYQVNRRVSVLDVVIHIRRINIVQRWGGNAVIVGR